jgi:hypothetical protein
MKMQNTILILQNKKTLKPSKWTMRAIIDEVNEHSPIKLSDTDPIDKIVDYIDMYTNYLLGEIIIHGSHRNHSSVDWHPKSQLQPV